MDLEGRRRRRNESGEANAPGETDPGAFPPARPTVKGWRGFILNNQGQFILAFALILSFFVISVPLHLSLRSRYQLILYEKEYLLFEQDTGTVYIRTINPSPVETIPVWKKTISSLPESHAIWKKQTATTGDEEVK